MSWNRRASDKAMYGPSCCYVVVTIGGRLFAFDACSFKGEFITEETPDEVVSIDGTVYSPLALADRLELSAKVDSMDRRVILLGYQDRRGWISVDRVHGQVAYPMSEIIPLPLHFQGVEREWYQGMILFQHSVAVILNMPWVLHGTQSDPSPRLPDWLKDAAYSVTLDPTEARAKEQTC